MHARRSLLSLSFVLFISVLFSACAPKGYVMPEYANQSFAGKTLAIAPFSRPPLIDNPSDVADDLGGGVVEEVYVAHFRASFPDSLRTVSVFDRVVVDEYAEEPSLESHALDLEKGAQMGVSLPPPGTTVVFEGGTPDVVLFLEDLRTERTNGTAPTMGPNGAMGGGSSPTLLHAVEYVYWDNEKGRVISYGKLSVDTSFFLSMKTSTWHSALGDLARSTVRGGPLARS